MIMMICNLFRYRDRIASEQYAQKLYEEQWFLEAFTIGKIPTSTKMLTKITDKIEFYQRMINMLKY